MIRKLLESLHLVKPIQNKPTNPYTLVWYRAGWSKTKTGKNNAKYWEWETLHNGLNAG